MKKILLRSIGFLIFSLFFNGALWSKTTPSTREAVLKKYSLDELDSAATLLRIDVDQGLDKKKSPFCGIKWSEAKTLLMPLKDLIDVKVKNFIDLNKGKTVSLGFKNQDCDSNCHCGIYATALDTAQQRGDPLTDTDLKYLDMAQTKASTQGQFQSVACAHRSKWFCSSPLLHYLRSQAKAQK